MSCSVSARSVCTVCRDGARGNGVGQRVRHREQLIERGGLGRLFGEAVAGGERGHFERADAIDEAIELRAQPRLGAGAAGRAQQNVDGAVERRAGLLEVPEIEIALALLVEPLGLVDEGLNGVGRRGKRRLDRLDLSRNRRRRRGRGRTDLPLTGGTAAPGHDTSQTNGRQLRQPGVLHHRCSERLRGPDEGLPDYLPMYIDQRRLQP